MTNTTPARVAEDDDAWELAGFQHRGRTRNLPKGHRFYSSPKWVRWFEGKSALQRPSEDQSHLPEMPTRFLLLDLDAEPGNERYMSLTERFNRLCDITLAVRYGPAPLLLPRRGGVPVLLSNYGPSVEWREVATAIWAALPANDSEIFARPAETENPKNGHLSAQLASLMQWARIRKPLSLNGTNWMQADNDNYEGEVTAPKPASNLERRIRPGSTDAELKSFIRKAGPCSEWKHAKFGGGGEWELMPTDPAWPTRAGKLCIANGNQEERGHRLPRGAILYQPDDFRELLGPEPDKDEKARSLSYWHKLMSYDADTASCRLMEPIRYKRAGRMRRKVLMTQAEQLEVLATQPHPPVTHCRPGLPCGHEDIGTQFVGGWTSNTKGKSGVERWQDVSDELSRQAEWGKWFMALPKEQRKALTIACTAANFRAIGEAFGKSGKNAERYGKRVLVAANDNLKKLMAA